MATSSRPASADRDLDSAPRVALEAALKRLGRVAAESDNSTLPPRLALEVLVDQLGCAGARLLVLDARGRVQAVDTYGDVSSLGPGAAQGRRADAARPGRTSLRYFGHDFGVLEAAAAPDWVTDDGDGPSPLARVGAAVAPSLALRAESSTRAREAARVRSLLEAAQASVSSLSLKDVLRQAMQAVRDLFEASGVAIWRLDEGGALRRFGSLGVRDEYVRAVSSMSPQEGVLGIALREGRPVAVPDLSRDPRVRMRAELEREGVRSMVSVPLSCRGRTIGALSVYYRQPRLFSAADQDALAGLANQVAAAIANAVSHATTERTLAEASAQRELLESVVRNAHDGILALDGAGRIVLFSPGCERLTGWKAEEARGRQLSEVLRCDCQPTTGCAAAGSARLASGDYEEVHVRSLGGPLRWLGVSRARVASRRANAARSVRVLRDVTGARELDEMKTLILSTVSHELRTPLTAIRAMSELLVEHDEASPVARQMAATINRESERLTRLVENAMDVARLQAGRMPNRPRRLTLATVLREAIGVVEGARRGHRFELRIAEDLPQVWADPDRLRQVLDNLLDNATKYSPPGSAVTVEASVLPEPPARVVASASAPPADGFVEVSVADQGPGIPAEEVERVFERFHRLSAGGGGSGLGLYLSRGLVGLMGGTIRADPDAGQGARLRFSLPLAPLE